MKQQKIASDFELPPELYTDVPHIDARHHLIPLWKTWHLMSMHISYKKPEIS